MHCAPTHPTSVRGYRVVRRGSAALGALGPAVALGADRPAQRSRSCGASRYSNGSRTCRNSPRCSTTGMTSIVEDWKSSRWSRRTTSQVSARSSTSAAATACCLRRSCGNRLRRGEFCSTPNRSSKAAPAVLEPAGVADRTAVIGGSFFESVPSGGDAYVLKHIIHDWDESRSRCEILRNVRTAMTADAKVLIDRNGDTRRRPRASVETARSGNVGRRHRQGTNGSGVRRAVEPGRFPPYTHGRDRRTGSVVEAEAA